jgi:hypothetical protein
MPMPDHVPQIDGDAGGKQAFACAFGYTQALPDGQRGGVVAATRY